MDEDLDYEALGFKAGLEIHQQLDGTKLFCDCPAKIVEDESDFFVTRYLRASVGESGEVDVAAAHEQSKRKAFEYHGYQDSTCLVELDEEPVSRPRRRAVETAVMVSRMLDMTFADTVHVMRKVVVDGSNTSGFQRTMLVAMEGSIDTDEGPVRIDRLCLEEDSCRIISREASKDVYNLSRLGIPLLEITTKPDIISPQHLQDTAAQIGMVLRSTGRVKRGLGTIRQDVNVSIADGARVEIKGVQALDMIPELAENEVRRQLALIEFAKEDISFDHSKPSDVTKLIDIKKGWVKKAVKGGQRILAIALPEKEFLGRSLFDGYRLGTELAGYVKSFGFGGLMHDAEPAERYGIKSWDPVRKALGSDGFVCMVGGEDIEKMLSEGIPDRLESLFSGVSSEVRKALDDGTTAYLRPMPGAARMYPETDVETFGVEDVEVELPELLTDRISRLSKQYGLSEDQARQLVRSGREEVFEHWAASMEPGLVYDVLVVREKDIKKRHGVEVDVDAIADDLLLALEQDTVAKSAVEDILVEHAKTGDVDWDSYRPVDEKRLKEVVREVIDADSKAPFGALMGQVMKRMGGKADGKTVSRILTEELGK